MFEASSPPATRIQIDASAHCQLACPSCPTASGATKAAMGAGHLDPAKFDALLADNPELLEVELSNYGEMFLNPRLAEILKTAHERDVVVHADNGVNLNNVSDGVLEAVVRYRVRSMTVSIDGATPESYAKYRVRGDFKRVIGNIRRLNQYKQQFKTVFPMLSWQFIVFGHNELEIAAARRLAGKLGMSFSPKVSWDDDVSPVRNKELVRIQTGLSATREEHHRKTGAAYLRPICHQLWHSPVVNWDGRIMGCCRNFWGEFGGNAFQDGLAASLESPAAAGEANADGER
jgi:MoaA/NifB/PqqE/SkfB family radical SAM enzyme